MTDYKPKPIMPQGKRQVYAIIGIILFVILVVLLVRKPKDFTSNRPPIESKNQQLATHEKELREEIDRLEALVKTNPDSIQLILSLAQWYQDIAQFEKAIVNYKRYLEKDSTNADARVDMGVSYYQLALKDTEHQRPFFPKAILEIEEALKYSPRHQLGHFNLGIIYLQNGDIEMAQDYLQKCISLNPESPVAQKAKNILDQHIKIQKNKKRKDT
jgi:tetratricopeptide (TPR) repeat protein